MNIKNKNYHKNVAETLWQQSYILKKYSINTIFVTIALIIIGIIMLCVGLLVKFTAIPTGTDGTPITQYWSNTSGGIYGTFPDYYPSSAKALQIVAIIGTVFFYIALIAIIFFNYTALTYLKKSRQALKINPSLRDVKPTKSFKPTFLTKIMNRIHPKATLTNTNTANKKPEIKVPASKVATPKPTAIKPVIQKKSTQKPTPLVKATPVKPIAKVTAQNPKMNKNTTPKPTSRVKATPTASSSSLVSKSASKKSVKRKTTSDAESPPVSKSASKKSSAANKK